MNDVTMILIYAVIAIAVIGTVAILLVKGRKTPPGTYTTTRDANDPVRGGGFDTLEAPPAPAGSGVAVPEEELP